MNSKPKAASSGRRGSIAGSAGSAVQAKRRSSEQVCRAGGGNDGRGGGRSTSGRSSSPRKAARSIEPSISISTPARYEKPPWDSPSGRPGRFRLVLPVLAYPVVAGGVVGVVLGMLVDWVAGMVAALVFAVMGAALLWKRSTRSVIDRLHAVSVSPAEFPRVAVIVQGICDSVGLSMPSLYVVDDPCPNALILGSCEKDMALVFTRDLCEKLQPLEIEAVMAHELLHLRAGEYANATMAASVALTVARWWPGVSVIVYRLAGKGRELLADKRAISLTRYPPALSSALGLMYQLAAKSQLVDTPAGRATRLLWTVPLGGSENSMPVAGNVDHPEVRIAVLEELY